MMNKVREQDAYFALSDCTSPCDKMYHAPYEKIVVRCLNLLEILYAADPSAPSLSDAVLLDVHNSLRSDLSPHYPALCRSVRQM